MADALANCPDVLAKQSSMIYLKIHLKRAKNGDGKARSQHTKVIITGHIWGFYGRYFWSKLIRDQELSGTLFVLTPC